jgi:hypothetical protein
MKKVVIAVAVGLILIAVIITFGQIFTVRHVGVEFTNSVSCADEQQVLSYANISPSTNIFVLDEETIAERVEKHYSDNSLKVVAIVREFPDKVIIKVSERIPIFKIKAETEDESGYVEADRNFQRAQIYTAGQLDEATLTEVRGYTVEGTYKTDECYMLRDIADALMQCGFPEEAIPYFVSGIEFSGNLVTLELRASDTKFIINKTSDISVKDAVISMYNKYEAMSVGDRNGKDIMPQ